MTARQTTVLQEFARHGGLLIPNDDEVRAVCRELTAMKLLRPQSILDGNARVGDAKAISVAYQVTAKGRSAAGPEVQ